MLKETGPSSVSDGSLEGERADCVCHGRFHRSSRRRSEIDDRTSRQTLWIVRFTMSPGFVLVKVFLANTEKFVRHEKMSCFASVDISLSVCGWVSRWKYRENNTRMYNGACAFHSINLNCSVKLSGANERSDKIVGYNSRYFILKFLILSRYCGINWVNND